MTNYKETIRKLAKRTALTALVGATFIGSCTFHKNDIPPLYTNKIETSYGICLSTISEISKGAEFNGLNIAIRTDNQGIINGANLSFANLAVRNGGIVNGLELGLVNAPNKTNDLPNEVNGMQIGLVNSARNSGRTLQLGIYNEVVDSKNEAVRRSLGINYANGDTR